MDETKVKITAKTAAGINSVRLDREIGIHWTIISETVISTVCILGALQRQVDLQGVFVNIADSIKLTGSLMAEFLQNRRS